MTRHVVLFKGQRGWYMTHEFVGDKDELSGGRMGVSCDEKWKTIQRRFQAARTLEEFIETCNWASSCYHNRPELCLDGVTRVKNLSAVPDDVCVVHEDYSATGMFLKEPCPVCGYTHTSRYFTDGAAALRPRQCFYCGAMISPNDPPDAERWEKALAVLKTAPGTATLDPNSPTSKNNDTAKYAGQPVKILKLSGYQDRVFLYDVLFRDWAILTVREDELLI